ncbi:MAG TPA: S8 family serine peptidase [Verrucomicrobiae bacterium]|nr:S8 family serine peptidase [Verrucomicrobiae bacterium]
MGFLYNPFVIRRIIVYGGSVVVLLLVLSLGRGFGQNVPHGRSSSLWTFDGFQHALMGGAKKSSDRDSNLQLRHELADGNASQDNGNSVSDKQVVFASAREITPQDDSGRPNYVPGQLIIRFRGGVSHRRQDEIVDELGGRILRTLDVRHGEYVIVLPGGLSVPSAEEQLAKLQEVDFAEPNVVHYINDVPNDQYYTSYQGQSTELQRWYFNGFDGDSNLNAEAAWNITTGSSNIVIAIIDTGVLTNHPDLAANLWTNPSVAADATNGYPGDINGWDFYNNDSDPDPDLGDGSGDGNVFHGTFVAGVAAAVSDNGIGIVGASWHSRIMPLKVFTNSGGAPSSAIAEAIRFAVDHDANVINMSFGSLVPTRIIYNAIQYAHAHGVIVVAAAGNNGTSQRSYPASYPNVISVGGSGSGSVLSGGSVTNMRLRASFSEYGPKAVDVVAPAVDIAGPAVLSVTDQNDGMGQAGSPTYFIGDGTSFASPLVAGEAALLLSRAQELGLSDSISPDAIVSVILNATTRVDEDSVNSRNSGAKWAGRGRVDYYAALQQIGPQLVTAPAAPSRLSARPGAMTGTVELNWTDRSNNEDGFLILRAERSNGALDSFDVIDEVGHGVTTYADTTAQSGTTYIYAAGAYNVAGTNFTHTVLVTAR